MTSKMIHEAFVPPFVKDAFTGFQNATKNNQLLMAMTYAIDLFGNSNDRIDDLTEEVARLRAELEELKKPSSTQRSAGRPAKKPSSTETDTGGTSAEAE